MNENVKEILALLIINIGGKYSTSYGVVRVFEIFFRFSDFSSIDKIINKGYVNVSLIDGINHFKLTEIGYKVMLENRESALMFAKDNCPDALPFLDNL